MSKGGSATVRPWERLLWLFALIATLVIMRDIYFKYSRVLDLQEQLHQVERGIEASKEEYQWLLLEQEFRRSDAFIERYAREELGWLRQGDLFFMFP